MRSRRPGRGGMGVRHALVLMVVTFLLFVVDAMMGCSEEEKEPAVYYGPPPVDGDAADGTDAEVGPVDAADVPADPGTDQPLVYYGPQPTDVADSSPDVTTDTPAVYYGPQPTDVVDSASTNDTCEPLAYYGPAPCSTDQQCIDQNGAGWYCDQTNTFDNGCGGTSTWPVCAQQ